MKHKKIYLIGFMGSGKSAVGRIVSKQLGWNLVDTDQFIENEEKMTIKEMFSTLGEEHFRERETQTLEFLVPEKKIVVSTGGGIVLREKNVELMQKNGLVVLLWASPETIFQRVKSRTTRPLLNDNMNTEHIAEMLEKRRSFYERASGFTVETDHKTPSEIGEMIIDKVREA